MHHARYSTLKISRNHGICGSIGYGANNKISIFTSIGILIAITFLAITPSIKHLNITKT